MHYSNLGNMLELQRDMKRSALLNTLLFILVPQLLNMASPADSFNLQASKFIDYDSNFSEEEQKQSKALKAACNLNNAACKLKLKDYKEAVKLCTKVQHSIHISFIKLHTNFKNEKNI